MVKRTNLIWVIAIILVLVATGPVLRTALAQRASTPKPENTLALRQAEVKQLLLLMDTNKNGKISKKEFLNFMEAEFDRLDKDKSGELDVKELLPSTTRVSYFASLGK